MSKSGDGKIVDQNLHPSESSKSLSQKKKVKNFKVMGLEWSKKGSPNTVRRVNAAPGNPGALAPRVHTGREHLK